MADTELQAVSLRKVFADGDRIAGVQQVDFSIGCGEGFSLLGPSGCGKTTTLRMIGGFEIPDSGTLLHRNQDITSRPPQKRDIRTVFQRYALFPHLDVFENVAFGLRTKRQRDNEIRNQVNSMLEMLEIAPLMRRRIHQLSGGEQQRVALARALVTKPRVLLLDEPLSALDLKLREKMQLELLSLRKRLGMTFVFVTHDQTEAMVLSDSIAVMNQGRMEQIGTPEQIYQRPRTRFVASFIGHANFFQIPTRSRLKGEATDLGSLPGDGGQGLWMMRPEQLQVRKRGGRVAGGHWALGGRMGDIAFLGEARIGKFHDELGACHLVKFPRGETPSIQEGEDAVLTGRVGDMVWISDAH